jgi:hypothetical protein
MRDLILKKVLVIAYVVAGNLQLIITSRKTVSKILTILASAAFCVPAVLSPLEEAIAAECIIKNNQNSTTVIERGNNSNCQVCGYSYALIVIKKRPDVSTGSSNNVGDLIPNSPVYQGGMAWA